MQNLQLVNIIDETLQKCNNIYDMAPDFEKRSPSGYEDKPLLQWFLQYAEIKRNKAAILNRASVQLRRDFKQSTAEQYITHRSPDRQVLVNYDQVNLAPPVRMPAFDGLTILSLKFPRVRHFNERTGKDERYDDVFVEAQYNDGKREQYLINSFGLARYEDLTDVLINRREEGGSTSRFVVARESDEEVPGSRLSLELLYEIMNDDAYDFVRQTLDASFDPGLSE